MATSLQDLDLDAVQRTFENYYGLQAKTEEPYVQGNIFLRGNGYVQGSIFSRGHGLCSFIKKILKVAKPLAKRAGAALAPIAKQAGRYALERGADVAIDTATEVLNGVPFKEAFMENIERAADQAKSDAAYKVQALKRRSTKRPVLKRNKRNESLKWV